MFLIGISLIFAGISLLAPDDSKGILVPIMGNGTGLVQIYLFLFLILQV